MPSGNYIQHAYSKKVLNPWGYTPGVHVVNYKPICPECLRDALTSLGEGYDGTMDLYYSQFVCKECGRYSYKYN